MDDEPLARRNIRLLLKDDAEIELLGECGSGAEAVSVISRQPPDLLFLDIQMPVMSGFDVLAQIDAAEIPAIIFVTAYDQYAIKAFEVHALDYLLKPFDDARFEKALQQAKAQIEQREINQLSRRLVALLEDRDAQPARVRSSGYLSRLMVKSASRVFFLKADEIDWIEAADYYVKLHVGRKSHLLRETMSELEAKLDPEKFLRIHRSSIVNLDRVKEMHLHFNGEYLVILHDGTELKLSRSRREQLQQLLNAGSS
ncbi:MAG: response regulator transcription factor [Acidobacteria bacterium]|nr:response regulator transcription factor [Acidobacteriota bacterium]